MSWAMHAPNLVTKIYTNRIWRSLEHRKCPRSTRVEYYARHVALDVKPLHGEQDAPVLTIEEARAAMTAFEAH